MDTAALSTSLPHTDYLVVLTLDARPYALRLAAVERVLRMVEITAVPRAPDVVLGIINMQGQIIPVVNLRKRFRLPQRPPCWSDQLVVAHTARRLLALAVDTVQGVVEYTAAAVTAAGTISPGLAYIEGVMQLADGMVLIHDLDSCLSLPEERALDEAIRRS
jgi:purine-binding chemotaxis protein CheW